MRLGLLVLFLMGEGAFGAKILVLLPFPFYSHTHTFIPVFKELAARGHHVTFLSPYPQLPPPQNWTNLEVDGKPLNLFTAFMNMKMTSKLSKYKLYYSMWNVVPDVLEKALNDKAFDSILRGQSWDHDLIITAPFMCVEPLVGLGHKHNVPVISLYPVTFSSWSSYFSGNDFDPSYIPGYWTTFSDKMTFLERIENTILAYAKIFLGLYFYLPRQELLMERYIYGGSQAHPPLADLLKNVSLHFTDSHYSLSYPRPLQPNTVQVGGLTMKPANPLPKELQYLMDHSTNGVIYLSFGSTVPVSLLGTDTVAVILDVFRSFDIDVLMKWENDTLPNKPANVRIQKWFPQPGVLAHPKCRLFITHGGMHGISEAAYHGVPMIGIPLLSDQNFNVRMVVEGGFGRQLLIGEITPDALRSAIEDVLNDKRYKERAMRRSKIMRDRPNSSINTAVYWIEYALRHKDLSHLRPASTGLPLYQLYLLDVFAVLLLCTFAVLALLFYSLRSTWRLIRNSLWIASKDKSE